MIAATTMARSGFAGGSPRAPGDAPGSPGGAPPRARFLGDGHSRSMPASVDVAKSVWVKPLHSRFASGCSTIRAAIRRSSDHGDSPSMTWVNPPVMNSVATPRPAPEPPAMINLAHPSAPARGLPEHFRERAQSGGPYPNGPVRAFIWAGAIGARSSRRAADGDALLGRTIRPRPAERNN
jgi:hypothetical protein